MSIYITKDGQKKKINVSATDVQLLDIDGRFKSKNLEDALKEVGSGTEENMTRIENKVDGVYNKNLFANGDFQVWSNGTTLTNLKGGQVLADKWILSVFGSSSEPQSKMTVSKTNDGMKLVCTQPDGNGNIILQQIISQEELNRLKGKTVTSSFVVKYTNTHNISSSFNVSSLDGFENPKTFTPKETLVNTSDYVTYSTTFVIPDNAKVLMPQFLFSVMEGQDCTIEIKSAKLEVGNKATEFVSKPYTEELLACNDGVIGSNPNLLINGDFQIWQRGTSFNKVGRGTIYTADRWRITSWCDQGASVTKSANGLKLKGNTGATSFGFQQFVEMSDETKRKLANKPITMSAMIGGDIISATGQFGTDINVYNNDKKVRFIVEFGSSGVVQFRFTIYDDVEREISYIKAELSPVATPYQPKPYSQELSDCQRYYCTEDWSSANVPRVLYKVSDDYADRGLISFPTEMRITPTINLVWGNNVINSSSYVGQKGIDSLTSKSFVPYVNRTSEGVNNKQFVPSVKSYTADAEIY